MSVEQVREMLGDGQSADIDSFWDTHTKSNRAILTAHWGDEDGNEIIVSFETKQVTGKAFMSSGRSFLERVKRRIQRRIRAL